MKPFLATLTLSLLPLAGTAQPLPSLVQPQGTALVDQLLALDPAGQPLGGAVAPVVPIWSGANGQLLAVVALSPSVDGPGAAGAATPGAWSLGEFAGASGMLLSLDNGMHLDALLSRYMPQQRCAGIDCNRNQPDRGGGRDWSNGTLAGSLGMGMTFGDGGFDLGYGLSWLQPAERFSPFVATSTLPSLLLPDLPLHAAGTETALFARGRWHFQQGSALDLSASYGHGQYATAGALASIVDLDKLSLSLGIDSGSLRGAIVGHVLSSDDPLLAGRRWTTLDLGVSWRTPWSGELSVGAQNLWSTQLAPNRDNENQARTPYIQYRQDL